MLVFASDIIDLSKRIDAYYYQYLQSRSWYLVSLKYWSARLPFMIFFCSTWRFCVCVPASSRIQIFEFKRVSCLIYIRIRVDLKSTITNRVLNFVLCHRSSHWKVFFWSSGEIYITNNRVWIPCFTIILTYSVEMERKSVLSNLSFQCRTQTFNTYQHLFPVCRHDIQNVFLVVLSRLLFSNTTSDAEYSKLVSIRKIYFIICYVFLACVTIPFKLKRCQETVVRLPFSMHFTCDVNFDFVISLVSTYSKSWKIPSTMNLFFFFQKLWIVCP